MRILICILVNNFQLICILVSNTTAFGIPRPILVPFIKIMFVHMQLVRRQAAVARLMLSVPAVAELAELLTARAVQALVDDLPLVREGGLRDVRMQRIVAGATLHARRLEFLVAQAPREHVVRHILGLLELDHARLALHCRRRLVERTQARAALHRARLFEMREARPALHRGPPHLRERERSIA